MLLKCNILTQRDKENYQTQTLSLTIVPIQHFILINSILTTFRIEVKIDNFKNIFKYMDSTENSLLLLQI